MIQQSAESKIPCYKKTAFLPLSALSDDEARPGILKTVSI